MAPKKKVEKQIEKRAEDGKAYSKEEIQLSLENVVASITSDDKFSDVIVNWYAGKVGKPTKWISTGLSALDIALGGRGIAMGKVIEIYGPPQCGKTTLAMHLIRQVQEQLGEAGVYLETESKIVEVDERASAMGVDTDLFVSMQASFGESIYAMATRYARTPGVGVIVVDSIGHLIPRKEYEKDTNEAGLRARFNSTELPMLCAEVNKNDVLLILINQERTGFTNNFITYRAKTGGKVIEYAIVADLMMDFARIEKVGDKTDCYIYGDRDVPIGHHVKITIKKNHLGPIYKRDVNLTLQYACGWDSIGSIMDLGVECGAIYNAGAWYYYPTKDNPKISANGKAKFKEQLAAHPEYQKEISSYYLAKSKEIVQTGVCDPADVFEGSPLFSDD